MPFSIHCDASPSVRRPRRVAIPVTPTGEHGRSLQAHAAETWLRHVGVSPVVKEHGSLPKPRRAPLSASSANGRRPPTTTIIGKAPTLVVPSPSKNLELVVQSPADINEADAIIEDAINEAETEVFEIELQLRKERGAREQAEAALEARLSMSPPMAAPLAGSPRPAEFRAVATSEAAAQTLPVALPVLARALRPSVLASPVEVLLAHPVVPPATHEACCQTDEAIAASPPCASAPAPTPDSAHERRLRIAASMGATSGLADSHEPQEAFQAKGGLSPDLEEEKGGLTPDSAHERRLRIAASFFGSGKKMFSCTPPLPLTPPPTLSPGLHQHGAHACYGAADLCSTIDDDAAVTADAPFTAASPPSQLPVVRVLGACNRPLAPTTGRARVVVVRGSARPSKIPTPRRAVPSTRETACSPFVQLPPHTHSAVPSAAIGARLWGDLNCEIGSPLLLSPTGEGVEPSTIELGFAALRREIAETMAAFHQVSEVVDMNLSSPSSSPKLATSDAATDGTAPASAPASAASTARYGAPAGAGLLATVAAERAAGERRLRSVELARDRDRARYERRIKELEAIVAALEGHGDVSVGTPALATALEGHGDVSVGTPALATALDFPSERESMQVLVTALASPTERESAQGGVSPAQHTTTAGSTTTVLPSRRLELPDSDRAQIELPSRRLELPPSPEPPSPD